jgi:hypothetical protein
VTNRVFIFEEALGHGLIDQNYRRSNIVPFGEAASTHDRDLENIEKVPGDVVA